MYKFRRKKKLTQKLCYY